MGNKNSSKKKQLVIPRRALESQGQRIRTGVNSSPSIDLNDLKKRVDNNHTPITPAVAKKMIGTDLKSYFNANDENNISWLYATTIFGDYYRRLLISSGNITSKENADLRDSIRLLKNAVGSMLDRTSEKTSKKILERIAAGSEIKILDVNTLKFIGVVNGEDGVIAVSRERLDHFSDKICGMYCENCTKNHDVCDLYDFFAESRFAESGHEHENCPYAFSFSKGGYGAYLLVGEEMARRTKTFFEDPKLASLQNEYAKETQFISKACQLMMEKRDEVNSLNRLTVDYLDSSNIKIPYPEYLKCLKTVLDSSNIRKIKVDNADSVKLQSIIYMNNFDEPLEISYYIANGCIEYTIRDQGKTETSLLKKILDKIQSQKKNNNITILVDVLSEEKTLFFEEQGFYVSETASGVATMLSKKMV